MVRRALLIMLGLLVVLAAVVGWAGWRALQVRTELTSAQAVASQVEAALRQGRIDDAERRLPDLQADLRRAHDRVHGLSWTVATQVPGLGANLRVVQRAADAGAILGSDTLPPLVRALDRVRHDRLLANGAVDLQVLRGVQGDVVAAAAGASHARRALGPEPSWLIPQVRDRRGELQTNLTHLDDALRQAVRGLAVAPAMLGAQGPRHYLVVVQNNAEARATGGLIGAYAVVRADHGRLVLERSGTNTELAQSDTPVVTLPGAARLWQDIGSTRAWYDANLTPDFPDAAAVAAALWRRQSGTRIDGVIGVDPLAMSELLRAGGPVRIGRRIDVTADNVVAFVGHDEYVDFPDTELRKSLLSGLAGAIFHSVVAAKDPLTTTRALVQAADSGHLLMWSRWPAEQAMLQGGLVGGALPDPRMPYLSVLTQNFAGNKLDYYLRRQVSLVRRPDGRFTLRIVLRNTAPPGLPAYMTVRADQPRVAVGYGQARVGVAVYGAGSSVLSEGSVDGQPVVLQHDVDHGHAFGLTTVEVPRGRAVTIELVITEPAGLLTYRQQPLVHADELMIDVPHRTLGR